MTRLHNCPDCHCGPLGEAFAPRHRPAEVRNRVGNADEEWRPIPGYEGLYDISSWGRARSWHGRYGPAPRILKTTPNKGGYPEVRLSAGDGTQRNARIHVLVAAAFIGPRSPGMQVRHLDGDPSNCAVGNLAYGSNGDNLRDAVRHGTHHLAAKTHCKHGHPFDSVNTLINRNGHRQCRACAKRLKAESYQRTKASAGGAR